MKHIIFGKDTTKEIVNISYKDDSIWLYKMDGSYEKIDHTPFVLTNHENSDSVKLKGNRYHKYITPTDAETYDERGKWGSFKPRSIAEGFMLYSGVTYFKEMKVNQLSLLSFDIETTGLNKDAEDAEVTLITNTFRDRDGNYTRKTFDIFEYEFNVGLMILDWCSWVQLMSPDILLGHNVFGFDLPYLDTCGPALLGRQGERIQFSETVSKKRKDGTQSYDYHNAIVHGREIVDTMFLSLTYDVARQFPSYGLKAIEQHLGLIEGEDRSWDFEKYPVNKYREWPKEVWADFREYAEGDSDSPIKMFDIMAPSLFYLNQSIPKTFQQMVNEATGSQIDAFMIRAYLQDGWSQPLTTQKSEFEGAISMGIPGIYKNVRKVDVASLYPSIMRQYKIFPYSKDPEKYFLKSLDYFTEERLKNKQLTKETGEKYYDDLQGAQKILINSMYGFMGASYLLYNEPEAADDVTRHGREILLKAVEWSTGHTLKKTLVNIGKASEKYEWVLGDKVSEGKGYSLVNVDTDSISYTNSEKPKEGEFDSEITDLNTLYPKMISWEDDGVFDKLIVLKAKNYIMQQGDKVKYKGSSIKDQKKEPILRKFMNDLFDGLLHDATVDQLKLLYRKYCKEALHIQNIKDWSVKKTITKSVLNPKRTNEQNIIDALEGEPVQEGDKVWLYTANKPQVKITTNKHGIEYCRLTKDMQPIYEDVASLKLAKHYANNAHKWHYVSRVHKTVEILANVIDINEFPKYHTKKNRPLLETNGTT